MTIRRPSDLWNDNEVALDVGDTLTISGNVTIDSIASQAYTYSYATIAQDDFIVKGSAGYLKSVIIGEPVLSGEIEISDHATTGDAAVKVHLKGNATIPLPVGTVEVDAAFTTGITADLTNQTKVTFIYR